MSQKKHINLVFSLLIILNSLIAVLAMNFVPYSYQPSFQIKDYPVQYYNIDPDFALFEEYYNHSDEILNTELKIEIANVTGFERDRGGVYDWGFFIKESTYLTGNYYKDVKISHFISYNALFERNTSILENSSWVVNETEQYWGKPPELFHTNTWRHELGYDKYNGTFDGDWRFLAEIDIIDFREIRGYIRVPLMVVNVFIQEAFDGNTTINQAGTIQETIRVKAISVRILSKCYTYEGVFKGWQLRNNSTLFIGDGEINGQWGYDPIEGIPLIEWEG